MRLEEFMQVGTKELSENLKLFSLLGEYENEKHIELKDEIIALIKKTNPIFLIKLAYVNPLIDQLCKHEALNLHWNSIWKQCGQTKQFEGYQPQSSLHSFDLIKGIYLYWQYQNEAKQCMDTATSYLQQAAEWGCYMAINALYQIKLDQLRHVFTLENLKSIEALTSQAALHSTPGYLLLANTYSELASIYLLKYANNFSASGFAKQYFDKALEAAQQAEASAQTSNAEMHNAYQGKTIAQVYQMKLSDLENKIRICASSYIDITLINPEVACKADHLIF